MNKELNLETHYIDVYPKTFLEFRKKYLKSKNLYVQFSNHKFDNIDKSVNYNPNHGDMVGNYAYPIEYVLNYPSDIWYGRNAKYLRVLKDTSKNKIIINDLTENQIDSILRKMNLSSSELKYVKKYFKLKGSKSLQKAFFLYIQHDISYDTPKLRTGVEQTNLFLKAGIDCIEDKSRNQNTAIINPREPNQIVFLTRNSFEIIETFQLNYKDMSIYSNKVGEDKQKKLANMIFEKFNEKLYKSKDNVYFSNNGKMLLLDFQISNEHMKDKKIGEKKHKQYKFNDMYKVKVILYSDKDTIEVNFNENEKFEYISDYIYSSYLRKEKKYNNYYTIEKYNNDLEKRKKEEHDKYVKAQTEKENTAENEYTNILTSISNKTGIEFYPNKNRKYKYVNILSNIANYINKYNSIDGIYEGFNKLLESGLEEDEILDYGFFPKNLTKYKDIKSVLDIVNYINSSFEKFDYIGLLRKFDLTNQK